MTQFGFYFDQSRCCGCQTCALACKNWHGLPPGPVKYLRIYEYEKGSFPDVRLHWQWIPCYHCQQPACQASCPRQAIYKEPDYGAVLIDQDNCDGCRDCYVACPYGAPVFESDDRHATAQKCNLCIDRLKNGQQPVCVLSCPYRALDFRPLEELVAKYGNNRDLEDMPCSETTNPSVIFKPHSAKRQLVPYDTAEALNLMMKRDPLPRVFSSPADVLEIPGGMVGRSGLVIKHASIEDLMRRTRNDEG